ncbi:succinyl-CoA synthetase subunit alpha (plasmid) [Variovorax sp. SRS16]|uniref:acetate--CoA ligase family protein n=1 Tax=Variovorax sp. SRS16 TaxID=282217 RepID=UPI001317C5C4|nr:acetate--CoA ligase family protein [Variovorax sp. SRS16]VTU45308.1 succinyl-CoA synthetase subunit alpha [Variovorax sp. SRS16]
MTKQNTFARFLQPRSIAVIGASPQPGNPRNALVKNLLKHGFEGTVYPVTPSNAEIEGLKAYKTVADLPEVPDVALVITPAHTVAGVIAECGQKGILNAIVFSSGFEEVEGGQENARQLAEAARKHGVTVVGPNCNGFWSVRQKAIMTFSGAALNIEKINHAPVAVLSQSGALAGAIANSLNVGGMGLSYIVSVGNETCVDVLDAASAIIEQDDVRVVLLYLEGMNDASRILEIAQRARERGVQIVALKTGRSAVGQDATASHTGKIASSHAIYTAVFEQAGVIEVASIGELMDAVEALTFLRDPRDSQDAKGGVSVLSASGGAGALLADHSSERGMTMSEFNAATVARLDAILPSYARKTNPIDLTGAINTAPDMLKDACEAVVADARTEAVIVQFASTVRRHLLANAEAFKAMARKVPVFLSVIGEAVEPEICKDFRDAGVLLVRDPSAAMSALSLLYRRRNAMRLPLVPKPRDLPPRAAPIAWADMMQFCEDSGVTPARWVVLGAEDRASDACKLLPYPLVVKALPSEAEHKTEMGLVKLRVPSPEDVDALAAQFRARIGNAQAGILVQEMVGDGVEVVLSCLRNADFGPVISIGLGGIAIELYRDVAYLALPVSEEQVIAALQKLKLWTLLQGFRGKPAADVEALARAAARFGDMFLASPEVWEFEINPVIVKKSGEGLAAVDALVTTGPNGGR